MARIKHVVIVVVLSAIGALLLGLPVAYRFRHTCVLCRLDRNDYRYLGYSWSEFAETPCTKWYDSNVEPTHTHKWARFPLLGIFNIYWSPVGGGSNSASGAIFRITPDEQIEIYEHFDDRVDAKKLFGSLLEPQNMEKRYDAGIVETLRDWRESGYSESWDDVKPNW